jgi:hypothetical protein
VQLVPPAKRAKKADAVADAPPAAAAVNPADDDDGGADPAVELEAWLTARGVAMTGVRIDQRAPGGVGWGLRAAGAAAAGAVLATVPAAAMLRADAALDGGVLKGAGEEAAAAEFWQLPLALRLLREQLAPASAWAGYTRALPGRFGSLPLCYRADELRALKSEVIAARVEALEALNERLARTLAASTDAALRAAFPGARPSASDLQWACCAASSRALLLGGGREGDDAALVPLLDLVNHASAPNCQLVRDPASGALSLVAREPLAAGAACTLDYGRHGSVERMWRYGFVDEADGSDFVTIEFDGVTLDCAHALGEPKPMSGGLHLGAAPDAPALAPRDPDDAAELLSFQASRLAELGLGAPAGAGAEARHVRLYADQLDGRLLAALRVLYAQNEFELEVSARESERASERERERERESPARTCRARLSSAVCLEHVSCPRARVAGRASVPSHACPPAPPLPLSSPPPPPPSRSQNRSLSELCSAARVLDDLREEKVRETLVGFAMLAAGGLAEPALSGGFGGGIGRIDSHMLVAGRSAGSGARSTNMRAALIFRNQRMRTAIAALRFAKGTLMHALPIASVFAPRSLLGDDVDELWAGLGDDELAALGDLDEFERLERQVAVGGGDAY